MASTLLAMASNLIAMSSNQFVGEFHIDTKCQNLDLNRTACCEVCNCDDELILYSIRSSQ